jgi:hypothetical protein
MHASHIINTCNHFAVTIKEINSSQHRNIYSTHAVFTIIKPAILSIEFDG